MTYWLGLHDPAGTVRCSVFFESLPPLCSAGVAAESGAPPQRFGAAGPADAQRHCGAAHHPDRSVQDLRLGLRKYGSPAPSTGLGNQPEGMRVYPSARTLATVPTWDWHRAGVDKSRYDAVYAYARSAESLKNIAAEGDVALLARSLHAVRGVGPWSISEALQRVCGHPDAISVGDYHLAHAVGELFIGQRTMMRECSPCWRL